MGNIQISSTPSLTRMIRNQWYAVLDAKEVRKVNRLVGVTRMGEKLVFWRDTERKVHCIADICVHRGVALSKGKVVDGHIQCPFHGLEYDSTGKCVLIPANSKASPVEPRFQVNAYPIQEKHGFIWLWWGKPQADYPPIPWFDDLDDSFAYSTLRDHWNAHYSRVIENQLDVVHLPFVHHNTIGRGNRTVVDGPIGKYQGDAVAVWVHNRRDNGQPPRKPEEIPAPNRHAQVTFMFPNIWQNYIAKSIRIMIAFTPIDNENTLAYIRYYHKTARIPGLKQFVSWIGKVGSRVIAHQDRRVVETQVPKRSFHKMPEQLIQGDIPIVLYRRRRQELIDATQKES